MTAEGVANLVLLLIIVSIERFLSGGTENRILCTNLRLEKLLQTFNWLLNSLARKKTVLLEHCHRRFWFVVPV